MELYNYQANDNLFFSQHISLAPPLKPSGVGDDGDFKTGGAGEGGQTSVLQSRNSCDHLGITLVYRQGHQGEVMVAAISNYNQKLESFRRHILQEVRFQRISVKDLMKQEIALFQVTEH